MQNYTEIPSSQSLQSSLALILNNDKTALSCSSGTTFPTTNLQVGMLCLRTDQFKLYQLKDLSPTWTLIADLSVNFEKSAPTVAEDTRATATTPETYIDAKMRLALKTNTAIGLNDGGTLCKILGLKGFTDDTGGASFELAFTDNGNTWLRSGSGTTWGAWRKMWHDANDGAGSGLDADLLDGMQSGNASGNIPINNGTVNANLNADMVDGYHVGNASGKVPVSNGTVNTNLNADTVDGFHASAFVRSIGGANPDVNGNVNLSYLPLSGGTLTGQLVAPTFKATSSGGDDSRSTGFQVSSGQDIGECNRWTQYYDDRAANCNGYLPNGNCAGNAYWNPPNGNWWTWGVSGIPGGNCGNPWGYDGAGGWSNTLFAVSVGFNYDGYYLNADEIGGAEYRRWYRNCNCGQCIGNCHTNCNCNCNCNCDCNCQCK